MRKSGVFKDEEPIIIYFSHAEIGGSVCKCRRGKAMITSWDQAGLVVVNCILRPSVLVCVISIECVWDRLARADQQTASSGQHASANRQHGR